MKKSIAVIGQGFVGHALASIFIERNVKVYAYDITGKAAFGSIKTSATSIAEFVEICETDVEFSNMYFVCLPTPMLDTGEADLSIVDGVLREISVTPRINKARHRIAIVKSTVPPGSTQKWNDDLEPLDLHVVFNPEFLVERTALHDMRHQDRVILGGPKTSAAKVKLVYEHVFPNVPVVKTSSTNAEMVKYVANCFLATKVSFANEMYQICAGLQKNGLDVDYDRIIECATLDKRLGTSHWKVPSMESDENGNPLFGFSLSCFPKDINALMSLAKSMDIDPKVLQGVWQKNIEVRPGKDWEKMEGRAVSKKKP